MIPTVDDVLTIILNRGRKVTVETNASYAKTNDTFKQACAEVGIPPTSRQAGKWRRKTGLAWKEGQRAQNPIP